MSAKEENINLAAVSIPTRPDAPEDLTEYQRKIWKAVVDTKPADWFEDDNLPILRAYCIAADRHRLISRIIDEIGVEGSEAERAMRMEDMYAKQLKALGVSMRLTQQSRYTPQAAATAAKQAGRKRKPWDKNGA